MKRYRAPKVFEGQIKIQKGKVDHEPEMCIFFGSNVPRCDRALLMNVLLLSERDFNMDGNKRSLSEELENRGYDLDTFKFSIMKKSAINENN